MYSITRRLCAFAFLFTALTGVAQAQAVDSITGGGWIFPTASNGRGSFGFTFSNTATPSGHLTYHDHGTGMRVQSTSITSYTIVDANTRRVTGICKVDGVDGFTFTATMRDIGEPSTLDEFGITIAAIAYVAHDRLQGGNVQLHPL
jgi:hypothetical protein